MSRTARISSGSDAILEELVAKTRKTKIEIIDAALEIYSFRERMRLLNEDYENLRSNTEAWEKELEERSQLEGTISDGLEDE